MIRAALLRVLQGLRHHAPSAAAAAGVSGGGGQIFASLKQQRVAGSWSLYATMATPEYVLPEEWKEDLKDEKGDPMSKK